nr:unnamed protein product [Callosobruchus analis]
MCAALPRKVPLPGRQIRTTSIRTEISAQSAKVPRHRLLCANQ